MKPLHDLSNMANALSVEAAPAAKQDLPNAPVVQSLDDMQALQVQGDPTRIRQILVNLIGSRPARRPRFRAQGPTHAIERC